MAQSDGMPLAERDEKLRQDESSRLGAEEEGVMGNVLIRV